MKSSTTMHKPRSLGVRSAQTFSPLGLSARSPADKLNHSTQVMQPRSQFSSGHSAHEPTSSARRAQPLNSGHVTQESVQFRPFSSRAYQLGQKSSATQLKTCYLGVSSVQAIQLTSLLAQLEELNHSTQDMLLRSQFNSGHSAHEPTSSVRRAQLLNLERVTQESVQFRPFSSRAYQLGQKSSADQLRTCYSGVSSVQAIQLTSLPARSGELSHSTQDVLLRSQFSSGHSAHEPTKLGQKSSATQLRTCYSRVSSV